jgi:hypothetical protein
MSEVASFTSQPKKQEEKLLYSMGNIIQLTILLLQIIYKINLIINLLKMAFATFFICSEQQSIC